MLGASMLEQILSPYPVRDFASSVWGKAPLVIKGERFKFRSLFTYDSVNRILNQSHFPHPTLKINKDGTNVKPSSPRSVIEAARRGATLIIENVERYDSAVGRLLDSLSGELCFPTRANLYFSQAGNQGYKIHYDTHDFFILQAEGKKEWSIFPSTVDNPLFDQKVHDRNPPKESELKMRCILEKGDVLYVPKGWWHYACATQEPSVHLTIALFARTGIDFLKWLVDEVRDIPLFRQSFPFITAAEIPLSPSEENPCQEFIRDLAKIFAAALERESVAFEYQRYVFASLRNHYPYMFPIQLYADVDQGGLVFDITHRAFLKQKEGEALLLIGYGKVLRFEVRAEAVIDFLLAADRFCIEDIHEKCAPLTRKEISSVLRLFLAEGFIKPVR